MVNFSIILSKINEFLKIKLKKCFMNSSTVLSTFIKLVLPIET